MVCNMEGLWRQQEPRLSWVEGAREPVDPNSTVRQPPSDYAAWKVHGASAAYAVCKQPRLRGVEGACVHLVELLHRE
jgi:hypothetical protein